MENFTWGCSTTFVFGKGVAKQLGEKVANQNIKRVLIVYGGGSAVRSGLLDQVRSSLLEAEISYMEMGGVRPNPEINQVYEGIDLAKKFNAEAILAVGGGSVIDCSKAISFGVPYKGDVWDFFAKKATIQETLPVFCVLTIPAAGSESSSSCVISNDALGLKRGVSSELFRPVIAFMDPQLTTTLPAYQTAAGATDMIAHICERWFSGVGAVPVTDRTAAGLIRTIMETCSACLEDPNNYDARANLMWAGSLAHNGIAGVGRNLVATSRAGGWESHGLEHELSAFNPQITHGAGLAVVMPAWMRYVWKTDPSRFLDFAVQVFDIPVAEATGEPDDKTTESAILEAIGSLEKFFKSIGMPTTMEELDLTKEDIPAFLATLEQNKGSEFGAFQKLTMEDARNIYLSAFEK